MPKIKAFIKLETKENAKKCIPLVSIYINSENPEGDFGVFAVDISTRGRGSDKKPVRVTENYC